MSNSYLAFPQFDPVIFSIGPVSLHWYGLMYLVGFVFAMWLAVRRANKPGSGWTKDEVENLLYAGFLGVFLGGRIGYVFFYNLPLFLDNPLYLFKVWDGGMSFHGGLIGVIVVMLIFAHRTKRNFFQVSDFIAPLIPFGLGAGRLGNFINGELWGRVTTDVPWVGAAEGCDLLILKTQSQKIAAFGSSYRCQRRCRRPRRPRSAGMPRPSQLRESQKPSPSNAANNPVALSKAITVGAANTFQKLDCRGFMPRAPLFPAPVWRPCAAPPKGKPRCRGR